MIAYQTGRTGHGRRPWRMALIAGLLIGAGGCGQPQSGPVVTEGSASIWSDVGRAAEARWAADQDLEIEARIAVVDDFGAETDVPALTFRWAKEDLTRVKRDADRWTLVNLATLRIDSPRGVMALADWCGQADGRTLTPRLCRQARPAAEDDWASRAAPSV